MTQNIYSPVVFIWSCLARQAVFFGHETYIGKELSRSTNFHRFIKLQGQVFTDVGSFQNHTFDVCRHVISMSSSCASEGGTLTVGPNDKV